MRYIGVRHDVLGEDFGEGDRVGEDCVFVVEGATAAQVLDAHQAGSVCE